MEHATGWSREEVLAYPERELDAAQQRAFEALVARRLEAEPVAYLTGHREFYGRDFRVDRRALIPRPETELLVDLGLAALRRHSAHAPRIVDVGTGCGAIAVSLALETRLPVVATDVSVEALGLARENAQLLGAGAVQFVASDLLAAFGGPLDVVLANLPYVPRGRTLPRDVIGYEPSVALFGGMVGTELIQRLLHEARPLMAPSGELCVELDEEEQAQPMAELARSLYATAEVSVCQDAGGYDRVVRIALP